MISRLLNLLKDKYFWINGLIAIGLFVVTGIIVLYSLKVITKWGQSSVIPNVANLTLEAAIRKVEDAGLTFEIKDTVFRKDLKEGTVIDIQPLHGLEIKRGRTVYLIISSKIPPMVEMPNLVGRSSLRFAKIEIESRGLTVGNLSYIPSAEKDAVLSQRIGNTEIKPGTMIPKGTTINLTLGDGLSGIAITPPFLIGKTYAQVKSILESQNILANFYFDKDIEDSSAAIVYNQYPSAVQDEKLNLGEPMDLFLGTKIPQNILKDSALKARLELENSLK